MIPDTFVSARTFPVPLGGEFGLGVFRTEEPERFGVLRGGEIVNKQPSDEPGLAWGVLAWSKLVAAHWRNHVYADYTQAINDAIKTFGYTLWELDYYFDIGSMSHYAEFLLSNPEHTHAPDLEDVLLEPIALRRELG